MDRNKRGSVGQSLFDHARKILDAEYAERDKGNEDKPLFVCTKCGWAGYEVGSYGKLTGLHDGCGYLAHEVKKK